MSAGEKGSSLKRRMQKDEYTCDLPQDEKEKIIFDDWNQLTLVPDELQSAVLQLTKTATGSEDAEEEEDRPDEDEAEAEGEECEEEENEEEEEEPLQLR